MLTSAADGMAFELHTTLVDGVNPFPLTLIVNAGEPATVLLGLMLLSCGAGKFTYCWHPVRHTTSTANAKLPKRQDCPRKYFTRASPCRCFAQKAIVETTKDGSGEQSGCLDLGASIERGMACGGKLESAARSGAAREIYRWTIHAIFAEDRSI